MPENFYLFPTLLLRMPLSWGILGLMCANYKGVPAQRLFGALLSTPLLWTLMAFLTFGSAVIWLKKYEWIMYQIIDNANFQQFNSIICAKKAFVRERPYSSR